VNSLLSSERLDLLVAERVSASRVTLGRAADSLGTARRALPHVSDLSAVHARGISRLEKAAAWAVELLRLAVSGFSQERSGLMPGHQLKEETIVRTRLQIQRYARDISANVAVVFVVLLLFVVALAS